MLASLAEEISSLTISFVFRSLYNALVKKWEMEEYQKGKQQRGRAGVVQTAGGSTVEDDERAHRFELQQRKQQKEQMALQLAASTMSREKRDDMQRQKQLQTQMQIAFQTGDKETYRRLKAKLEADDK